MANFLNTSKINFLLEELIQTAKEELLIISPYLKFNDLHCRPHGDTDQPPRYSLPVPP
jgi:hypothetical protein